MRCKSDYKRIRISRQGTFFRLSPVPKAGLCGTCGRADGRGVLTKQKYEDWRYGKVDYLERVCNCNLKQLSFIMKQIRAYSIKAGYKPSFCYYKRWGIKKKNGQGHKPVIPLRFSKSGNPEIEKAYATHYVDTSKCKELKKNRAEALIAHE